MKDFGSSKNTVTTAVMFLCELYCRAIPTLKPIFKAHTKKERKSANNHKVNEGFIL